MRYVIAYDISDDRRRTRLAHALEQWGNRVQYSVFECELTGRELVALLADVEAIATLALDRVRIYRLCAGCAAEAVTLGLHPAPFEPDVWIV